MIFPGILSMTYHVYHSRRPGDVASCYASSTLAERELGFKAEKSLTDMCKLKFLASKDIVFSFQKNII